MAIHWKNYHLNRMIQDALRDRGKMHALLSEPEKVFEDYRLSEDEKSAFRDPDPAKLQGIGVHPILAMVYMIPLDPAMGKRLTTDAVFVEQMKEL